MLMDFKTLPCIKDVVVEFPNYQLGPKSVSVVKSCLILILCRALRGLGLNPFTAICFSVQIKHTIRKNMNSVQRQCEHHH